MSYSQTWLESPSSIRGILVELGVYDVYETAETTQYLSTVGYITSDASVSYNPIVVGGLQLNESISIDNSLSMSFGDIELFNPNGELDNWLDPDKFIWSNRVVKVYYGDPTWVCADIGEVHSKFQLVFSGLISDIDAKSRNRINIKIRDNQERLNTSVVDTKIGDVPAWSGKTASNDTVLPVSFGEPHNTTPILVDPSNLEYVFSYGNVQQLTEIRDNGVPIYRYNRPETLTAAVVDLTKGTFRLTKQPLGTCTVSLQGINGDINLSTGSYTSSTYTNNIPNIIALLVTKYGAADKRLSASDIDLTNFSAFLANNLYSIGLHISDRSNLLQIIQEILSSVNAQIYFNRTGKLQIIQVGVPTSDPTTSIYEKDILFNTILVSERASAVNAVKIAFSKNYTIQSELTTNIPAEHKELYNTEWLTTTATSSAVVSSYKISNDPEQVDTLLIGDSDAYIESTRRINFYSSPKMLYTFSGTPKLLSLKLGQQVTLTHSRFNLNGSVGQVVSLNPDWLRSTIEVGVLI